MSFWVSSSFNDLLYPIPTFDLKEGLNVMLHNPEVRDAGQLWQSDYGETQPLDAWRNSYILTPNPDGTYHAVQSMPGGGAYIPLILTKVPSQIGTIQNATFEAHGDSTTRIPSWPEGAVIRPETYQDEFGNTQTRNPVGRGGGISQWWENPDDWTIITGVCQQMTQTCADAPTAQWATIAHNNDMRFYVEGGEPQVAYQKCVRDCNGTWTETKQIVDLSEAWHWAWREVPEILPQGWRIDKNGHLTNLPVGLEVSGRTDALEKGVSVIAIAETVYSNATRQRYNGRGEPIYTVFHPCVWHTNPEGGDLSKNECQNHYNMIGRETDTEYFEWAISEAKDYANAEGIKTYWWLESPTFTASCADTTDPNYNKEVHYWDPTRCINYNQENGEELDSNGNIPWVPIAAAGTVIAALTMIVTVYGGSMTWGPS